MAEQAPALWRSCANDPPPENVLVVAVVVSSYFGKRVASAMYHGRKPHVCVTSAIWRGQPACSVFPLVPHDTVCPKIGTSAPVWTINVHDQEWSPTPTELTVWTDMPGENP